MHFIEIFTPKAIKCFEELEVTGAVSNTGILYMGLITGTLVSAQNEGTVTLIDDLGSIHISAPTELGTDLASEKAMKAYAEVFTSDFLKSPDFALILCPERTLNDLVWVLADYECFTMANPLEQMLEWLTVNENTDFSALECDTSIYEVKTVTLE